MAPVSDGGPACPATPSPHRAGSTLAFPVSASLLGLLFIEPCRGFPRLLELCKEEAQLPSWDADTRVPWSLHISMTGHSGATRNQPPLEWSPARVQQPRLGRAGSVGHGESRDLERGHDGCFPPDLDLLRDAQPSRSSKGEQDLPTLRTGNFSSKRRKRIAFRHLNPLSGQWNRMQLCCILLN